jgi:hypothetical protein
MRKVGLLLVLVGGCRTVPDVLPREQSRIPLAIVTLDGVRAEDIYELPHLSALAARGVALEGLRASGPRFVSLPGYREIFSGRPAGGCTSNACGRLRDATLLDELADVVVMASWEGYEGAVARAPGAVAISAGRRGGVTRDRVRINAQTAAWLDRGAAAGAWPGHDDYRPDRFTEELVLSYLDSRQPRVLVVGLGDTDEHAHRGNLAAYRAALSDADAFIGALERRLDPETILIVTTDHGRSPTFADHGDDDASGQVWLVAAGGPLPRRGLVYAPHHLRDLAPTLRALLGLERDPSPLSGSPMPELSANVAVAP